MSHLSVCRARHIDGGGETHTFLDDWSKDHEPLSMVARVLNPNLIRSSSPGALKTREGVKIKILPGFPKTNYLLLVLVQF